MIFFSMEKEPKTTSLKTGQYGHELGKNLMRPLFIFNIMRVFGVLINLRL